MDWAKWHDRYDVSRALMTRLRTVRERIVRCLASFPPGPIHVLSICSGDGRDLIGALTDHARAQDVRARLIELDFELVERGRAAATAAGLARQLEFVAGDATAASAYRNAAPADLVLACGVFGNVRKADTPRLVDSLTSLCTRGGFLIWTRGTVSSAAVMGLGDPQIGHRWRKVHPRHVPGSHAADSATIRALLQQRLFEEVEVEETPERTFLVGTSRHLRDAAPFPSDGHPLFVFTHS